MAIQQNGSTRLEEIISFGFLDYGYDIISRTERIKIENQSELLTLINRLGIGFSNGQPHNLYGGIPIPEFRKLTGSDYVGYLYYFKTQNPDSQDSRVQREGFQIDCFIMLLFESEVADVVGAYPHIKKVLDEHLKGSETWTVQNFSKSFLKEIYLKIEKVLSELSVGESISENSELKLDVKPVQRKRRRWFFLRKRMKMVILGDGAVGKTSLVEVFQKGKPLQSLNGLKPKEGPYQLTERTELYNLKTLELDSTLEMELYDVAGQIDQLPIHMLKYSPMHVFEGATLITFMFANDDFNTFLNIKMWIELVEKYYSTIEDEMPPFILINNKMDQQISEKERLNTLELITGLMKSHAFRGLHEISCMTGAGIDDLKKSLIALLSKKSST